MDRYPYRYPITSNPLLCGPPRIAGARTTRTIYTAEENTPANGAGQGQRIEWLVNGVVTNIRTTTPVRHQLHWNLALDIVKEGTEHLCSDGFTPQRLNLQDLNADIEQAGIPCWIPVRRGEEWLIDAVNTNEFEAIPWQLALTLDELDEAPQPKLWVPNETQFYRVSEVIQAADPPTTTGEGTPLEIDFQHDGVVTGWRASVNTTTESDWYDIGFDILRNGTDHLVTNGRSSTRLRTGACTSLAGGDAFQPCWFPVNKHEKWQTFARNFSSLRPNEWSLLLRVEEFTDRSADLFGPNAYQQGI